MTVGTGEAFRRRVAGQVDRERREAEVRGVHPVDLKPTIHPKCGRRLKVTRGFGNRVVSVVHEDTGLRDCTLPIHDKCEVCEVPGLIQCTDCGVRAHPSCMRVCRFCSHLVCPEHCDADGLCPSCAISKAAAGV